MAPGGTKRSASPPSAPKPKKQRQGASSGSAGSSSRPEPAVSQVDVGDQPQSAGSQAEIGGQPQLAVSQAEAPKLGRPGEDNLVVRDDAYVLSVRQGLSGADAVCFDRLHKPIADYFDRRHCLQEDQRRQLNGIEPEVLTTILLSGMEPGSRATFGGELTPGLARRVLDATSPFQGGDTNIGIYVIILLPKPGRRGHVHVYVGSAGGPKGFEGRITQHLSERFRAGEPGKMLYKQIARGTHDIKAHVVISLPFTFVVKYGRIFLRFAESAIVSILSSYHIIMASKADMVTEEPLSPLGHLTLKRQQEKLGHYGLNFSVPWLELGREQPVGRLFSEGFSQVIGSEHKTDKSRLFWNITMCFSADGSRQHLHVPAKVKRDLAVCPLGDGSKLTARVFVLGERSPPGTAHEHAWVDLPDEPRYRDARRIAIGLTAFDRDQPNQLKTVWLKNAWRRRNDTKAAAYIHSLWLTSIGQLPLPVPAHLYAWIGSNNGDRKVWDEDPSQLLEDYLDELCEAGKESEDFTCIYCKWKCPSFQALRHHVKEHNVCRGKACRDAGVPPQTRLQADTQCERCKQWFSTPSEKTRHFESNICLPLGPRRFDYAGLRARGLIP